MNRMTRLHGLIIPPIYVIVVTVACTATPLPPVTTPLPPSPVTAALATATSTPPPSATPPSSPTPLLPTLVPTPSPFAAPSVTPDLAGVGLPCPSTPPAKPDYATYVVSAAPWPTADPAATLPPLSLADPLPAAGRNTGYPYGSDGSGRYLLHNGLDMADENDSLAVAVADGTVIVARDDLDEMFGWRCDWYGQLVVLQLDETWNSQPVYALYGHIKDTQVSEGQHVARGEPVAREGTAGVAVVPHLHLEVRAGTNAFDATQNPLLWVAPWSGSGVIAGRLIDPDGRAWQGVTLTLIDRSGLSPFLNTWSYLDDPDHLIRPDPALGENFVFGPVSAGTYDVYTKIQGVEYRQSVEVKDGALSIVEIVTEPFQTPTAQATSTP